MTTDPIVGPVAEGAAADRTQGSTPAGRTVAQVLAQARELVEPAHRAVIDRLPEELRLVAGYHAGWWDGDGTACRASGKAVRPALVLSCARACGGGRGVEAAIAAAVAVELVHDFTLLHDDVMDGDRTRRGRPAAWTVFGHSQAILVGDALLVLALDVLADTLLVSAVSAALVEVCAGQWADLAFENRSQVTLDQCLAMAEDKTGALLGAACQLGALAAGAAPQVTVGYRVFGRQLGMAFQLIDDLLGIWGDPGATGKPAGADLAARKMSLPVVAALASGTDAGQRLARLYRREVHLDDAAIAHAAELVEIAGGRDWARAEADRRTQAALHALAGARPTPAGHADLVELAALIARRDR